jgi:DNA-binding GntR family transcriptional regulator
MIRKKRTRNNDPAMSDGATAHRKWFIEIYGQICNHYDQHRLVLEALDGGNVERAAELIETLVEEYEDDVRKLTADRVLPV